MDALAINSMQYHAPHGFYAREREEGNQFEVDLLFEGTFRPAGNTDDLAKTINYEEAERIVGTVMNGPSRKLIETLASSIGDQLFKHFQMAQTLRVTVRKLDPPLPVATHSSEITCSWSR